MRISSKFPKILNARLFAAVPALLALALPSLARETVVEDSPGRLVLEVEATSYSASPGEGGWGLSVDGVPFVGAPTGAPDLPHYVFAVAAGSRQPSVHLEPLEWVEVEVPGGLRGVPRWKTVREAEPYKDPALFAAAAGLATRISEPGLYRGLALRNITLPLGTYAEGSGRARMLKKFRVTVTFANPASSPSPGVQPWLERAAVKNPRGGAYLVSLPRRQALRKAAGAKVFTGGTPLLKIRIGDGQVDGFEEDGMYALSFETARELGLEGGIDINRLRLYAGPTDTGTLAMGTILEPTLREIPIEVIDVDEDGTFDEGDRILFYAQGTSLWKPIAGATEAVRWSFSNDPWSFERAYYLDWNGSASGALRLDTVAFTGGAPVVEQAPHYLRGERELGTGACDLANVWDPETGHIWYWYSKQNCPGSPGFTSSTPTLTGNQLSSAPADTLKGRAGDSVHIAFYTYPQTGTLQVRIWIGGAEVSNVGNLGTNAVWHRRIGSFPGDRLGLDSVRWVGGGNRLEGFTVRYTRNLVWDGRQRRIFPAGNGERLTYRLTGDAGVLASLRVVRVEQGVARKRLTTSVSGGAALFSDSAAVGEDVHYLVYQTPRAVAKASASLESVPTAEGVIADLTTGDDKNPEYLIITSQALVPEALELRTYRQDSKRLLPVRTQVVRVEDIYREWSGGRLSPVAIRDFLRYALHRWNGGNPDLKYVLLLGDGHYDYRNLRNGNNASSKPNIVPPFNWDGDYDPMNTDDFFVVLDSAEFWNNNGATADLSIGRVPAQTREQARSYLEKIREYEDPSTAGDWRGRVLLAADDATQRRNTNGLDNVTPGHTNSSEALGSEILQQEPGTRFEKVYLFDYKPNASFVMPEATQDFLNQMNRGVLMTTFFGHGAYNQLADEVLLKSDDGLSRLRNAEKAFAMLVLSCTVGRFDKLIDEGMTEQFLRQKDAGIIVGLGASRESYPSPNESLGKTVVSRMFGTFADSIPRPMGDAVREAKNLTSFGHMRNNQKYVLIGEPVTVIRRPGLGLQLNAVPDTLQALGCGTLSGRVTRGSGKGRISVRIVSGDIPKVYPTAAVMGPQYALKRGQILFESTTDYKDSAFSVNYFLPKQIPFGDTAAKIQIFAWDKEQPLESSYLIPDLKLRDGGSCIEDTDGRGPKIAVTGCNLAESGGVDFPDKVKIALPYCLQITVKDTVGGVLSGDGPDEGTTVEVLGRVAPFHPQAGVDDLYTKTYQTTLTGQELPEGTHLLKITARDGFGNLGSRQIALEVTQDTALRFVRAFNVPNPMKRNGTTFHFSTTLPVEEGGDLTSARTDRVVFDLRIFNQAGYMVREFRDAKSGVTRWDGKDAWGRQLANGVYFYQVTATWPESQGSPTGGRKTSKKNVLVISR